MGLIRQHPSKTILFCVLNWGLGHASRSIPLIRKLHEEGHRIILASDGNAGKLLRCEFPYFHYIELNGYSVKYWGGPIWGTIICLPLIFRAVVLEKRKLRHIASQYGVDIVISDNRYGCFSKTLPSYFISHQLNPFLNLGNRTIIRYFSKIYARYVNNFTACLVPDFKEQRKRLAGKMAENKYINIPVLYTGIWSSKKLIKGDKSISVVAIVSGPEPSRSQFERFLVKTLHQYFPQSTLVLGRPINVAHGFGDIQVYGLLSSGEVSELVCSADIVICRSGYSSVMDICCLGKKAVLIPTKGMPEQEIIADALHSREQFMICRENASELKNCVEMLLKRPSIAPVEANQFTGVF